VSIRGGGGGVSASKVPLPDTLEPTAKTRYLKAR